MAPLKNSNNNKKKPASKSFKGKEKIRSAASENPIANLDKSLENIAILGENRGNFNLLNGHHFDLENRVLKLLNDNKGYDVYLWRNSSILTKDATNAVPIIEAILVPNSISTSPPPFVAYKINGTVEVQPFSEHHLCWNKVAPRVFVLKLKVQKRITKTSMNALGEEETAKEEHIQLWTMIPSATLGRNRNGEYDVRSVNYKLVTSNDEEIFNCYEKGISSFDEHIENMIDGNDFGEDPEKYVKDTIKGAFAAARAKIAADFQLLKTYGYDEESLSAMKTVKIYPLGHREENPSNYINAYYLRADEVLS